MDWDKECHEITREILNKCQPGLAVKKAMEKIPKNTGRRLVIAVGKAAWIMAKSAVEADPSISQGLVITKYQHVMGDLPKFTCLEAGHPLPDENSLKATEMAMDLVAGLNKEDCLIFLLSGGGSALFESPLIPLDDLVDVNQQLLACGADIVEINTIRKRLSKVKGGKFGILAQPASIYNIILSDVIGGSIDMVASGPTCSDTSSSKSAMEIVKKYGLKLSDETLALLKKETPAVSLDSHNQIIGSVSLLCKMAQETLSQHGYKSKILSDCMQCEAKEAGSLLGSIARTQSKSEDNRAYIFGGENTVVLTGKGKGGRNQELALSAAREIQGLDNVAVLSIGSDGTDGPTDAAGGYVTGRSMEELSKHNIKIGDVLKQNDSYNALKKIDQLLVTGPTGTNINDVSIVCIRGSHDEENSTRSLL